MAAMAMCAAPSCTTQNKSDQEADSNDSKSLVEQDFANDKQFLDYLQKSTFDYMWDGAEANSGLAPERIHFDNDYPLNDQNIVTTGGSGFGIAGIIVAIDRGFISREEGVQRLHKIVDFLGKADRYHGIWSHWIDGTTGKTKPFGEKDNGGDLVESSFLMTGLLIAREYLKNGNDDEKKIATDIDKPQIRNHPQKMI